MVISRTGLAEGDTNSICSCGSDSSMQLMVKAEAEKGRERRFRLAIFCLLSISQAVNKMTEVENIRRISMFCSALFCALLDTKVTDLSSFTMKSFRIENYVSYVSSWYHPSCLCLSTKSRTFLERNNDFTHGSVISICDANPDQSLVRSFCCGDGHKREGMVMGIMFHGTHPEDNVAPICRDGIHDYQGFTNFFHYAVRRSEGKQSYDGDAKVLAMAVIVEAEDRLGGWKDAKIRTPGREYALPLFVVTVRCN